MEVSEISFLRQRVIEVRLTVSYCMCSLYSFIQPDVFVVEGKGFLEKMRHTSCFNVVREIKSFITTFTTMEGQPEDFSSYLQGFLEVLKCVMGLR